MTDTSKPVEKKEEVSSGFNFTTEDKQFDFDVKETKFDFEQPKIEKKADFAFDQPKNDFDFEPKQEKKANDFDFDAPKKKENKLSAGDFDF